MKIPIHNQTLKTSSDLLRRYFVWQLLLMVIFGVKTIPLKAEGSKDFVNYPGYRMFLDTRDPQQLKVYANAGEYINVGGSHVGLAQGFIVVIDPLGDTIAIFDNTGANTGLAIINNNLQEVNGPVGTANSGYNPGVIPVPAGKAGIWTVIFDYPSYENTSFTNILNNAPWTRAVNQPDSRRVVLAWDVTVTSGAAGNQGGVVHEGRLYSNEHISLINGNGFNTSPVFYVLTPDGYLYQVNFQDADPFRFPISSNSRGLVDGNLQPVYKSKQESAFTRSNDPASWAPGSLYLYEPQAQDNGSLINNKLFFNIPDNTMPSTARVTDIFRNNPHETWLMNELQILFLVDFTFVGLDTLNGACGSWTMQEGQGGWFVVKTNLPGQVRLELDLDKNGTFGDPADRILNAIIEPDTTNPIVDSIYWDGKNGLGNFIQLDPSFELTYRGLVRFGELHIAMTDVENNPGGVTFTWMNAPTGYPDSIFYYDHSDIQGLVSGGGSPGNAQPTSTPFPYQNNFGNDKYIDQWFFIEYTIVPTLDTLRIVQNCACIDGEPQLAKVQDGAAYCAGDDATLSAVNNRAGTGNLTYTWIRPNGTTFQQTVAENATSVLSLSNLTQSDAGTYRVFARSSLNCTSDTLTFQVVVNPVPAINGITGGGAFCEGDDVTLSATNTVAGIPTLNYSWSGPSFSSSGTLPGNVAINAIFNDITEANEGTYSLLLTSNLGCVSDTYTANITVNTLPLLGSLSGSGAYCQLDDITLSATNSAPGITTMTCFWTGPNGLNTSQTVTGTNTVQLALTNVSASMEGTYTLYCVSNNCTSNTVSYNVDINQTPEINAITQNTNFCVGGSVLLTAQNNQPGTGSITYTWTGPNPANPLFPFTATVQANGSGNAFGPFPVTIPNFQAADAGVYTLVLEAAGGCQSVPQTVTIGALPTPQICNVTGAGQACIGQNVTLSASNCSPGVEPVIYIWRRPDNSLCSQGVGGDQGPFTCSIPNVQVDDAGTYTLTLVSDPSGCVSPAVSVNLSVLPGLNITNVTPNNSYCESTNVILTASNTVAAGNLTYTWTGPGGTVYGPFTVGSGDPLTVTLNNITASQAGNYILNVTSTAGCTAQPVSVFVGVYAPVSISGVSGGGSYCTGDPITLSASVSSTAGTVNWTWSDPNGGVVGSGSGVPPGPFSVPLANPQAGTYTFNVLTPDGCADAATASISFNNQPVARITNGADTTLCELDTLALCGQNLASGVGVFEYTWVTPNGDLVTGSGTGNSEFCETLLPLVTYGSGLYTLVISANGCTSEPDSIYVFLNPNPVISTFLGGGTYCEGDTARIQFWNTNPAIDSFYYTCLFPGGIQTTGVGAGTDTITALLTASGFLFCSLESFDRCVSSLGGAEVIFEPAPDIEITSSNTVCANETLSLNAVNDAPGTGTVTYTWTGPGGYSFSGTAPWAGPFPASDTSPATGEYCLSVSNGGNCTDEACIEVTTNPVPEVVNGAIVGGGEFCSGSEVTLSATVQIAGGGPINYTWTLDGSPVGSGTIPSGSLLTIDGSTQGGTYCLVLTSEQGCKAGAVCTQVTILETPSIQSVTGGGTYCETLNVNLNGQGVPGLGNVEYTWLDANGNSVCTGTAPSAGPFPCSIQNITVGQAGVYTLVLSAGDCVSEPQSLVIEVNPMPVISASGGGGTFCEGTSTTITFTIDPNGANSVNWILSGPIDSSGTVSGQTTTLSFNIVVNSTTAGSYSLTATSDLGCEAEPKSVTVSTKTLTPPVLSVSSNELCPGDELQLTTTAQTGTNVTYEWFKDGASLGTTTVPVFTVLNPTPGSYSVRVDVDGCTGSSAAVSVSVLTVPDAVNDDLEGEPGKSVSDNVLDNDVTNGDVTVAIVNQPTKGTVTINQDGSFTYTPSSGSVAEDQFTYEICRSACQEVCDQAVVKIVFPNIPCVVPNILTPNGDGDNDVLVIDCLSQNPNSRLRIFNRWGDEIFVAEPYQNNWDGTYGNDKKELPAATYFYLFQKDRNSDEVKGGYIEVVR
jgi:gliding motility-associated-like protein